MTDTEKAACELARAQIGAAYVFGAWGAKCTVAERKKRAGYRPAQKDNIYKTCQVLNGKKTDCAGCRYDGRRAFDCRGLTDYVLKTAGVTDLYGDGATAQYNAPNNWAARGLIHDMPETLCCVFRKNGNVMAHTGLYIGCGEVIEAKNSASGVVKSALQDGNWTHFAVPKGTSFDDQSAAGTDLSESANQPTTDVAPPSRAEFDALAALVNDQGARIKNIEEKAGQPT